MKNTKVLLCGFPKTGNTWVRLILANYFNILNFNATESMSKKSAMSIFKHDINKEIEEKIPLNFKEGFPGVYHTHNSRFKNTKKEKFFKQFNKFVYIYRNPYDLLISYYYHTIVSKNKKLFLYIEKNGLKKINTFHAFVKKNIFKYIKHVTENISYADLVLDYDELRRNTDGFKLLIKLFVNEIDERIFKKAIEMSSFENTQKNLLIVKKKQIEDNTLIFLKTRDGRSGQYKEVMLEKTIEYIKNQWRMAGLTDIQLRYKKIKTNKNKVLICGIQKTGNTWTRFVMFNYFNILNNDATKTLTFDELKNIHDLRRKEGFNICIDGFPYVCHTHVGYNGTGFAKDFLQKEYNEYFNKFDKLIYIYRNPFDTIISYHKFIFNRDKIPYQNIDMHKKQKLEDFAEYYLKRIIKHIKTTRHRADVILNYDELRKDPSKFIDAIKLVDGTIDMNIFQKAVKISSFDNIRKMSDEVKQPYGVGGSLYRGYFCRDGRTGQYKEIMSKELIEYIKTECEKVGLSIWE